MSYAEFACNRVISACDKCIKRIEELRKEEDEECIAEEMQGYFGFFKKTREQAIKSLRSNFDNLFRFPSMRCYTQMNVAKRLKTLSEKSSSLTIMIDSEDLEWIESYMD